jgi:glycosyltransferase involved in cell wall biosynthesis
MKTLWHVDGIHPCNMKNQRKNRVAIIGTVGVPACYGGFETLAEHLIDQTAHEQDITVYCSGKTYAKDNRKTEYNGAKLKYIPLEANGVQSIAYDSWSIIHALFTSDVLLVLGVAGAWLFPFIRLFTNKRIIVSIDGIEWKRDKWGRFAKLYLWWAEGLAVKYSHIDISDNESIQDYTAQRYGTLSQIIEYGADHASAVKVEAQDKKEFPFLNKNYAFKVCRIEPENNVEMILEAFAELPRYNFVLVGNWEKSEFSKELYKRFSNHANIHLIQPIYDQRKLDVLRSNAHIYVHGHSAGGTNPSLVEAMFLGLPIFSFGVSYNRTTTDHKALYFNDKAQLKSLIQETSFVELKALGQRMENIAKLRYTWRVVGDKYSFLIRKALKMKSKNDVKSGVQKVSSKRLLSSELAHLNYQSMFFEN